MQSTQDILDNQPWSIIEDQIIDDEVIISSNKDEDDDDDDNEEEIEDEGDLINSKSKQSPTSNSTETNVLSILAQDFTEKGLASFPDDWDGDEEEFREKIYEDIKSSVLEDFKLNNPIVAGFLDYVSNGGSPEDYIQKISMSSALTASDEEVYMMYMKSTTNFSDEKIRRLIEKSKDLDDFADEVEEMREEIQAAQKKQIDEMNKSQALEKKQREQAMKEELKKRKEIVYAKSLMGTPVSNNKEFEKFYLIPSESYEHEGQKYQITPYQKRLLERQKNKVEYEAYLAYLEFTNYNLPNKEKEATTKATSKLKEKLQPYITKGGKSSLLIDET